MSDTEVLSPTSENGDSSTAKKRMSEQRDNDSSDESSSYEDKVASSQNGVNGKEVHSNSKEDENESEDEGSHGFTRDGEPDYKPRKARAASSSSESEEEGDDVDEDDDDEDSSARSNRNKIMKSEDDSAISKSSESAVAPKKGGSESSSDTEDDASKDINEDDEEEEVDEKLANAPVPMARKVSVPADTTEEFSREEYELSKRETVNVEDATRKVSAVQINEDSDSEPEEDNKKVRTYSSSEGEDEVPVKTADERRKSAARPSSSSSEEADDGNPIIIDAKDVQPRVNGGAEIRRPQFRNSASSLSDEEVQIPSEPSPKHKIEERKQLLAAAAQEVDRPPSSQSPLPTRANADKITKMYTEAALGNNNNDQSSSSKQAERAKPTKDITSIYTQAMVNKSTPPASPKPVPSKARGDITQLYTGGFSSKSPAGNVNSPCVIADKLSPKKHNMATAMDKDAIRQAYDDVRDDNSETEWAVFKFEGNNLNVTATGKDFKDFKSAFTNDDRGFGYIRISTGDEMSKRAKFVFVTWVGPSVSVMKKAKMSTDKALMKDIIQNLSVELQLENHAEFSHDFFKGSVDRASGARYGTGERVL